MYDKINSNMPFVRAIGKRLLHIYLYLLAPVVILHNLKLNLTWMINMY